MLSVIAGFPTGSVEVPPRIVALADGRSLRPVWRNEVGGLTFEVTNNDGRLFIKWQPPDAGRGPRSRGGAPGVGFPVYGRTQGGRPGSRRGRGLARHHRRARGECRQFPLAQRPGTGRAGDRRGAALVSRRLPVKECPFPWSAEDRVKDVRRRAIDRLDPRQWYPEHQHLSVERALGILDEPPPVDRLVVCHGDACAPNTLIAATGRCSGHVDLGSLGVADRWADLAVATWSTQWNYGEGWESALLEAYGVDADAVRPRNDRLWTSGPTTHSASTPLRVPSLMGAASC